MRANREVISRRLESGLPGRDDTARTDRAGYRFESRQRRSAFLRMLFRDKTNRLLLLPLGSWEVIPPEKTIIPSVP